MSDVRSETETGWIFSDNVTLFVLSKLVRIVSKFEVSSLYWFVMVVYSLHSCESILLAFTYAGSLVLSSETALTRRENVRLNSFETDRKFALVKLYADASCSNDETDPLYVDSTVL